MKWRQQSSHRTFSSSHNDYYYFTMFRKPERKVTVNMHGPFIFVNPGDFQQFYAQMGRMVDDEKDSDDEVCSSFSHTHAIFRCAHFIGG